LGQRGRGRLPFVAGALQQAAKPTPAARPACADILAGKVRGRLVVNVNA